MSELNPVTAGKTAWGGGVINLEGETCLSQFLLPVWWLHCVLKSSKINICAFNFLSNKVLYYMMKGRVHDVRRPKFRSSLHTNQHLILNKMLLILPHWWSNMLSNPIPYLFYVGCYLMINATLHCFQQSHLTLLPLLSSLWGVLLV